MSTVPHPVLIYVLKFPSMDFGKNNKNLKMSTVAGQFVISHGSYDLNLGSEILILGRDIKSRSWPNIDGTYGILPD